MSPEDTVLIESRRAGFHDFYNELMPCLVEFVGNLGITPAHTVLNHAERFVPLVEQALQRMPIESPAERVGMLARVGYFFGEYFVQKYDGCWYVNDVQGSRYFGRYVAGQFLKIKNSAAMIDPFEVAEYYVDSAIPREMAALLAEVESALVGL